jgi:membrane fusion protein (multidrug efflux system)
VAAKIVPGEVVKVETEARDEDLEATVERISPVVDPATGTVRVTLRLPDGTDARVGGFVKARLTTDRKRDVLAVPKLALVEEGGLRSVFVAAADTVRKVEITTGLYDETHVEVLGGLEEGWTVVTLGRGGLRTGTRVEVLEDSDLAELASR